ncbi:MAG TPA: hypothetical protein VGY77_03000, partial [Gemmataceae bacterium]|nr:hypothetical protein [Gemmataceae bacterium]
MPTANGDSVSKDKDYEKVCSQAGQKTYEWYSRRFFSEKIVGLAPICEWSRLWMEGDLLGSKTETERVAAADAHLIRIQKVHARAMALLAAQIRTDPAYGAAADYYLANAEFRVAHVKGKAKDSDILEVA